MNERGFITATMHELDRLKVIEAVAERDSSLWRPPRHLCKRRLTNSQPPFVCFPQRDAQISLLRIGDAATPCTEA
ncbi:hypothetical protein [Burkholderia sp. 8Y]|uniref:hypothetical protein n=1 Tax=Burkholderia sp. 8Y TaxID=2653133 RepID=UPI0013577531|nr:hypothetical protein [Burkholderia sp. 8Y]